MTVHNVVWLDTDHGICLEQAHLGPTQVSGPTGNWSVTKRTLRGGLSEGVEVVRVDNGRFTFEILPTRGMSLWKGWLEGQEVGWRSPVRGPVHPHFVPLMEPGGLGWLEGFDELLVRCGLESNGAPEFDDQGRLRYPLHGRIGNRPAHYLQVSVDDNSGEITVTGVVEESRFHFLRLCLTTTVRTRPGEPGLRIVDRVENLSACPAEVQMLYHVNFGPPLLEEGSQVIVPARTVVPRTPRAAEGIVTWDQIGPPQPGFAEQVYFLDLLADDQGHTRALLKNARADLGVSLHFNRQQLPCFTLWKDTGALEDGYVTGLEPGVNFPNPRSHEGNQGRVVKLTAGQSMTFDLGLELHCNAAQVAGALAAIEDLRQGVEPITFDRPQPGWCAG